MRKSAQADLRRESSAGSPLSRGRTEGVRPGHDKSRLRRYIPDMTLADLEKAVATLPPDQLAKFRTWFDAFDAARFDEKIERDATSGKLDGLAEQALADFQKGRARKR